MRLEIAIISIVSALLAFQPAKAETREEKRNHIAVFVGNTELTSENHSGFTIGAEYERRVSELVSIGIIGEHAFGEIDATSILGTVNFHATENIIVQTGAGIEIEHDGHTSELGRVGLIYEIELKNEFSLSPQVHFDFGKEEALVFGVAIGKKF